MTLADRLQIGIDLAGVSQGWLEQAAALPKGYASRILKGQRKRLNPDLLERIAASLKVDYAWLATGNGPPPEGAPAESPSPPPTSSAPRPKDRGDHWFPDHIEDWFAEVLQSLGDRRYTGPQVRAAKVFIREGAPKLPEAGPRTLIMGALEAARELDEASREMEPGAILTLLIEKNAPVSVEEMRLREEARRMYEEGLAKGKREVQKNRAAQKKKVS